MKHKTICRPACQVPMYPNAADANYFRGKALEILTALVTGTGAVTGMLFLLTMA